MSMEELKKEFYEKFTDGIDEENDFYDSQFEGEQPYKVWQWIEESLRRQYDKGVESAKERYGRKTFGKFNPDKQLLLNQYGHLCELQEREYNIVTCGNCGAVNILTSETDREKIQCYQCGNIAAECDYPDLFYKED